jgi:hypothetical protein
MRRWILRVLVVFSFLLGATLAIAQQRAPENTAGGTVVLRGSTPANATAQQPPGPSNPITTGPQPQQAPAPAHGWDASGFDRQFDRSGLTPR